MMKNSILLFLVSILFLNCSENSEEVLQTEEDFTVTLNVDANHSFGNRVENARAYLSNAEGDIIASSDLQPGQSFTLTATVDDTPLVYDLSFLTYKILPGPNVKIYQIKTYTNIQAGEYNLGANKVIEDSADEIFLNLYNTGYPCQSVASPGGHGTLGPENGGYYNYESNLVGSPTSDFYMSLKSPDDQYNRYVWLENVPEGYVLNKDYKTLPIINNIHTVQIPQNDYSNFSLYGMVANDVNHIQHFLAFGNFAQGNNSLPLAFPENIFDNYIFDSYFAKGNVSYGNIIRTTTLPSTITTPALDITVSNPSLQNFVMNTSGTATAYRVAFSAESADQSLIFDFGISGEVTPSISFSKERLVKNIQEEYPDLSEFSTLSLISTSLNQYSYVNTYLDFQKFEIEGDLYDSLQINESIKSMTKSFQ